MSLSGMIENRSPSGEAGFVMPANAGIQVRFSVQVQKPPGFRLPPERRNSSEE